MNYNEDLKKLRQRHPQDFPVQQIVLEMFIVSYAFTGKMDYWKKSQRTQKIQFLPIPLPVVRLAQSKACLKLVKFAARKQSTEF